MQVINGFTLRPLYPWERALGSHMFLDGPKPDQDDIMWRYNFAPAGKQTPDRINHNQPYQQLGCLCINTVY